MINEKNAYTHNLINTVQQSNNQLQQDNNQLQHSINQLAKSQGIDLIQNINKASIKYKHPNASTFLEHARNFFEYPNSSTLAMAYMLFQSILIIFSITGYCIDTLPNKNDRYFHSTDEFWAIIEYVASTCFFLDTSIRLALAKNKGTFIKSFIFIIDILTIPSFGFFTGSVSSSDGSGIVIFLKYLRFFRILRFMRYMKISRRVSITCVVIKDCAQDLYNFLTCFMITITVTGSVAYMIEKTENESFSSIPQGMWWSLQTYLTIGYGDIVPKTIIGKIFSAMYMFIGILTLMLPVLTMIFKLVKCMGGINLDDRRESNEKKLFTNK